MTSKCRRRRPKRRWLMNCKRRRRSSASRRSKCRSRWWSARRRSPCRSGRCSAASASWRPLCAGQAPSHTRCCAADTSSPQGEQTQVAVVERAQEIAVQKWEVQRRERELEATVRRSGPIPHQMLCSRHQQPSRRADAGRGGGASSGDRRAEVGGAAPRARAGGHCAQVRPHPTPDAVQQTPAALKESRRRSRWWSELRRSPCRSGRCSAASASWRPLCAGQAPSHTRCCAADTSSPQGEQTQVAVVERAQEIAVQKWEVQRRERELEATVRRSGPIPHQMLCSRHQQPSRRADAGRGGGASSGDRRAEVGGAAPRARAGGHCAQVRPHPTPDAVQQTPAALKESRRRSRWWSELRRSPCRSGRCSAASASWRPLCAGQAPSHTRCCAADTSSPQGEQTQVAVVERAQEIAVQKWEVQRRERELEATVRRPAEAEKFKLEKLAEAQRLKTVLEAEAEAEAVKVRGEAEAYAIKAKAVADAEQMSKKAEAWKEYGSAAMVDMMLETLPKVAAEVAAPLSQARKVTMVSCGGGEVGAAKLTGEVLSIVQCIPDLVKGVTGVDISKNARAL
ncbi:uncharacterized protein LOC135086847 isoform X3 [Ostrinia nubilalis]|uniref:uncharacterized protein LOC135086847 isoform X3 n=1 Tax=Ostrinia nubilalis TaxID=29057 RepID=UPI003082490E